MNSSTGCALWSARLAPAGSAGVATRCSAGSLRVASTRSLSAPGAAHEPAQVADRSAARRRPAGAARAGTAPGPWSPAWTPRRARRGRRAWRAGSRRWCWRGAASSGSSDERARASATFSAAIAAGGRRSRWRPARRGRRGARRRAVTALRGVHEEVGERALVLGELRWRAARGRQQRVEVLRRLAGLRRPCPRTGSAKPSMTPWRSLARVLVDRVEELVEVDDRRRLSTVEAPRRPSSSLRSCRARRERDVAVGDARQRGARGSRRGCPRAAARRAPATSISDRARGCRRSARSRVIGADPPAPDLHVVVLDELARGLEQQRVLVARARRRKSSR